MDVGGGGEGGGGGGGGGVGGGGGLQSFKQVLKQFKIQSARFECSTASQDSQTTYTISSASF